MRWWGEEGLVQPLSGDRPLNVRPLRSLHMVDLVRCSVFGAWAALDLLRRAVRWRHAKALLKSPRSPVRNYKLNYKYTIQINSSKHFKATIWCGQLSDGCIAGRPQRRATGGSLLSYSEEQHLYTHLCLMLSHRINDSCIINNHRLCPREFIPDAFEYT